MDREFSQKFELNLITEFFDIIKFLGLRELILGSDIGFLTIIPLDYKKKQ